MKAWQVQELGEPQDVLRWVDVDFDQGLLRINSNYVVRSGQRRLKGTKTDDERRLSLDVVTVQLLETLLEARRLALAPVALALPAEAFVFSPDPLGERPWHPPPIPPPQGGRGEYWRRSRHTGRRELKYNTPPP